MHFDDEEEYLKTQSWNRQEKKKPWLFYLLIATVCFAIAWVMS